MPLSKIKPIAILGAGSWGTALALYLARRGQAVRLWSVVQAEIDDLLREKVNQRFLPGYPLPDTIQPMSDLAGAIRDIDDILIVVPSAGFRQILLLLKPHLLHNIRIICATKGLDDETGYFFSEVADTVLGKQCAFAVLSGPSFAREVAAGLPCAVTLASKQPELLSDLQHRFQGPLFGVETTSDVIGVQWGGVAKNVIAIATGIADGLGWGANARSVLITRGLADMMALGIALGGKRETFLGLSGLGDLILTCSDNQSRNRRLGLALGKGQSMEAAEREIGQVVEGARNAELVCKLAERYQVNIPVCQTICHVLQGKIEARKALENLLASLTS